MTTKKRNIVENNSNTLDLFNLMIENSPILILRDKVDATITYINKSVEKFFNVDRKDIIGKKWLSDISQKQKEGIKKKLKEAAENLTSFQHTVSYKLKNDETKFIKWITTPLVDDEGKFLNEFQAFGIDVTDKKYYQEQLGQTQEYLSLFFKQSLYGFFIMEADEPIEWSDNCNKENSLRKFYHNLKLTKVNKAFLDQYNAKENEVVGLSPADFFVHNYNYGLEVCKKILDAEYITLITDERKFNGKQMWVEAQYFLIKNENSLVTGLFGIQSDVTEKVNLENELKENEFIFRNSFDNNPFPIWIYDIDSTEILAVNKAAIEHYGYSKSEFLKMKLHDLNTPDTFPLLENTLKNLRINIDQKTSTNWKHVKKDGTVIDVEIHAQSLPYKKRRARINLIIDLTETLRIQHSLKESEESYKGLFNSISDAIYIQDKNGVFLNVNNGAEKMYGYNKDEFIGRTPLFLSAPGRNDFEHVINCINETYSTGKTNVFEFWGLRKNGEVFPKDVTINKTKYFGQDVIIAVARDITERKNFEAFLETSEENFKSIFNQFHEAIIIHDFDGKILEANEKISQLYGYSLNEIKNISIYDISSDINMQQIRLKKIWQKVKTGEKLNFGWVAKKKNGETFDVEVSLQKNFWSGNEVVFAFINDITEKKKIEKELQDTEESYIGLFNSITDFIFILNVDGIIVDVNNSVISTLNTTKDEIINHSISSISVSNKNNFAEILNKINHTYYTATPSNFEFWIQKKDGGEILSEVKLTQTKYKDKTVVIALARDITEKDNYQQQLKESEKLLSSLYENASIGIFRSTLNGEILFANPALVKMFGYESFDEFKNIKVQEQFYIDKELRKKYIDELMEKKQLNGVEYDLYKKDKSIITVREHSRIIKNEKGEFEYIEGTLEDITDKRKAEIALRKSESYLKELNATKDKFFSIIAHDLRSPFQGLLGISSILVDEEMDQSEKEFYFKRLQQGIKNLHALIEDLLTWSRVQRGVLEYYPEKSNLKFDIEDVLNVMNELAVKKNINLTSEIEDQLICSYDKYMINTVLRNLISNAIKFTPSFGSISVNAYKSENEIIVTVKDSGVGITKEDIQKIFRLDTPFTRRGTDDEPGTGLGLILCQEFIKKHNSKLWVESEVNKGSTFSFSLPLNLNE